MFQSIEKAASQARALVAPYKTKIEASAEANFRRVLDCFRAEHVSAQCFHASDGYGYDDMGRDKLEELYARVFGTEAALVRQQMISGTHAITLALMGNLLPGDELLYVGMPYDTLQKVIGIKGDAAGTMLEMGIHFRVVDVDFTVLDPAPIVAAIRPQTKIVAIQRSRGYAWRPSLSVAQIETIIRAIKTAYPHMIVFVDNCYGEMVEPYEPSHIGADLMAGSLIKNLGAGLAPGGGYIVGRQELVERAAYRLSVPGAGREVGASLISNRLFYQALFMAPQIVKEAVLGSLFISAFLPQFGFSVSPALTEPRADIIVSVRMQSKEQLIGFCQGIQKYSPIDSFVRPEPAPMPGYENDVIMAAGTFIQGSTIELSADAPLREPYIVYMQGGLNRYHVEYALCQTMAEMDDQGLL